MLASHTGNAKQTIELTRFYFYYAAFLALGAVFAHAITKWLFDISLGTSEVTEQVATR